MASHEALQKDKCDKALLSLQEYKSIHTAFISTLPDEIASAVAQTQA
jgi:hypothetical protein